MVDRKYVRWSKNDSGVATLVVDNPPMNVVSSEVAQEIEACAREIAVDQEVVAVVVTGAGERAFMAGADIRAFSEMMKPGGGRTIGGILQSALNFVDSMAKPTVAAIHGYALGGGLELALACDIRVAAENAQLGVPEIKLGLFPGGGGTQRLPRLIGEAAAKEMIFIGDPVNANDALRLGLVNRVVPVGQDIEVAQELASKMASKSGAALAFAKKAIDEGALLSLEEGLKVELDCFEQVFQTEDIKEGVDAFLNKRPPKFKHR